MDRQRKKIDKIDKKLLQLLDERMELAEEIGRIKKARSLPVLDALREEELVKKLKALPKKTIGQGKCRSFSNTLSVSAAATARGDASQRIMTIQIDITSSWLLWLACLILPAFTAVWTAFHVRGPFFRRSVRVSVIVFRWIAIILLVLLLADIALPSRTVNCGKHRSRYSGTCPPAC
ncbi:MAG: chorismate mutase [Candidatus Marinimicrobia bacterium]|nr:chorismate mutase [Candidatus Neomarinimicrobiota bacterium]